MRQNRLNVTLPAQACSNEVRYQNLVQMKTFRNAAEIVGRFCAKLDAFRCAFLGANVYTRNRYHGNIIIKNEII